MPAFENVCMRYAFKDFKKGSEPDTLLFTMRDSIFTLNFRTGLMESVFRFDPPFDSQPNFFSMNSSQNIFVIASENDALWYN